MSWLDKLKAIFNIELNSPLISINITKNSNNKNCTEGYAYDKENLKVFWDELPSEKKQEFSKTIKEYIADGNKLLETETAEVLHNLYKYNAESKNQQILNFFKPIIPQDDFEALECALYLRSLFQKKQDIKKLKSDIRQRFGDRGNNITNLCTAGYFEEFLMPLYNSSKERFNELYELIVAKSVVAVFVYSSMLQEEIMEEVTTKLTISRRYGIEFIHVHGIGAANISKIKQCIKEKKDFFDFFEKEIYEKDNIIIIELLLK